MRIEPSLTSDGRTKLKFTPLVLYGRQAPDYEAGPVDWSIEYKRPCKTYDEISWEVTFAANQFVVVGTRFDEMATEETLGSQFFLHDSKRMWMQRLLIVARQPGGGFACGDAGFPIFYTRFWPGTRRSPSACRFDGGLRRIFL